MDKEKLNQFKEGVTKMSGKKSKKLAFLTRFKDLKSFKKYLTKKNLIIGGIVLSVLVVGIILRTTVFKPAPKSLYQVAIMVRSQHNKDPKEDRKNSLKAGDVLVVQPVDHKWSATEKVSYLMLRMNLSKEQKEKLISPDARILKEKDLPEAERKMIEEEKKRAEESGREYRSEVRSVTERARLYKIDLAKINFSDPLVLLNVGQPYLEKTFDWSIVDKKESLVK